MYNEVSQWKVQESTVDQSAQTSHIQANPALNETKDQKHLKNA